MFSEMWETVMDLLTGRMSTCEEGVVVEESEVQSCTCSRRWSSREKEYILAL